MEFHPKSSANFLAIRKDLYASSPGGRLYRSRLPTSSSSSSASSGNVSYHHQHETRLQLLQVAANERAGLDLFGGRHHAEVGQSPESQTRQVEAYDDDGNTEDDEDNPRLYIDQPADECSFNNNCQSTLECDQCGKQFASKVQFSRHLRSHSSAATSTSSSLNPHSPHTAAWRLQCALCDSAFERQEELQLHEQTSHPIATSTTQTHATSNNTVHSTTGHHDASKTVYECDQPGCLRHYTSYSSFMKHRKTHATNAATQQATILNDTVTSCGAISPTDGKRHAGEKKFQCGQCSKRFPTSKDLKRHDVVHTGNREFQCSFCSHRFGRKDHRMRHEKKTHAAELSPPPQQNPVNPMTQHISSFKTSPPHPPSPTRHASSSPVLLQQQDQLVVQRQPQWSRRALTPPLPSPHGLKMEHFMDTIDEDPNTLSPLMDDSDSMSERKPLDLQKILSGDRTPVSNGTVPLDEMTLTSEDADEDGSDDVKSGLDWIISEFMSDDDLPKNGSRETTSAVGFYPEVKVADPGSDPYQSPAPTLSVAPKEDEVGFGDFMTRTKNPVLPSVYVDNSQPLIVPEPSKQRYHNSARALLFEEDDFMADVDVFLREKDIFSNI